MRIEECAGYKKLLAAVKKDEADCPGFHDYQGKLQWIVLRANHYEQVLGIPADEILEAWESHRSYWYMNYYQDVNQPFIVSPAVRVFNTQGELLASIGKAGFRCPMCGGVSSNPYKCNSGLKIKDIGHHGGEIVCNWNIGGLFRDLGKGVFVYVKSLVHGERLFMPIAWEKNDAQ